MGILSRYALRARENAFRHPIITGISAHVNFWVISFGLFGTIVFLLDRALMGFFEEVEKVRFWEPFGTSLLSGLLFGLGTGLVKNLLIKRRLDHLSSISRLLLETLIYFILFILIWRLRIIFSREIFSQRGFLQGNPDLFQEFQFYTSSALLIYVFFNILLLNFILQINTKYGPGVLIPMLLGYYRKPETEIRILLFMDLKDSTPHAEKLGHLKYCELIQECIREANYVVIEYNAQIYQYVGDEIVLSWEERSGLYKHRCLNFFLEFQRRMKLKELHFLELYGLFPEFKAGIHIGEISAIEVGVVKREIAFHGDAINTASRIQDMCNVLNRKLLFSRELKEALEKEGAIEGLELIGEHKLKGKVVRLELYSLSAKQ
jgi:adenylate cyclase